MKRQLTYAQAINEGLKQCMEADPRVYLLGLGVPDPKGIFGTTLGLREKLGDGRVMDIPCSENAVTGIAIGSALIGMRPVMTHQRVDFSLLALEQIVNQAANWHYMFGGKMRIPLVVRMLVGRGWGQGPQHSQNLHAWFAHIPGLKVVMPATPNDAKGLLISSIQDDNPVIFIEHRWLHGISGEVPEESFTVPIGSVRIARDGKDITIVCASYMLLEGLCAADMLLKDGISAEIIDVRTIRPLDMPGIVRSVNKTGRLLVADTGWVTCGFGAEVVARVVAESMRDLKCAPRRIGLPDCPTPTSPALARDYYPRAVDIHNVVCSMMNRKCAPISRNSESIHLDVPDAEFKGPF